MAKTSDIAETLTWHSETPCVTPEVGVGLDDQVLTIIGDLPHDAAISSSEIDAIERYVSDILDVVLGMSVPTDTICRSVAKGRIKS